MFSRNMFSRNMFSRNMFSRNMSPRIAGTPLYETDANLLHQIVINNKSIALTQNFVIIICCNETSLAGLRVSKQLFLLFLKYNTNTTNSIFYYFYSK